MHLYVVKIRNESAEYEDIPIVFMSCREVMEQLFKSFLIDDDTEPRQLPQLLSFLLLAITAWFRTD